MYDLNFIRPLWAEIDLNALAENMQEIRRRTNPEALITAVVKANACCHGAVEVAPTFLSNGADRLAVAVIDEAIELREAGIEAPILILGYTEPQRSAELVSYNLDQTIFTEDAAKALSEAALAKNHSVRIHIKIDSGIARLGFIPNEQAVEVITRILALPNLIFEGLSSHFATADEADKSYSMEQMRRYEWIRGQLADRGLIPHLHHFCNSAGVIDIPEAHMDMVRPGIVLYGILPSNEVNQGAVHVTPALTLKARISNVKTIADGETVSYGRHYTAQGARIIATLPIGYADGYSRLYTNRADVLVHGKRARVVGSVCMDQCMIDVTDIPDVQQGDEAVLIGSQGNETVTVEELAAIMGTIPYETICSIGRRIPRVYLQNGEVQDMTSYLYDIEKNQAAFRSQE